MAKNAPTPMTKYMIIDLTSVEHTAIVKVAHVREAALWGQLYKARGRNVTVREVAGRSFSYLDKLQLQYLFWNTCQQTPPDQYDELIRICLEAVHKIEVAETTVEALQTELEAIAPSGSYGGKSTREPKDPNAPPGRPKALSTTGMVWEICDELFKTVGNQIPERKAVLAKCESEGINAATASTQYSKWKKAKEGGSI